MRLQVSLDKQQTTQGTTPTKGVVLLAFGKIQYYWAAYNLAFSIRKHNKDISITVLFDDPVKAISNCGEIVKYVNRISAIDAAHLYTDNKLDPGKVKVHLYQYLPYDCNLYLDVDAVALKDIQPMINELSESGKDYASHTVGYHTIDKGRDFKEMQWAWADRMWPHFGLSSDAVMPAINSSMQWIVKGKKAAAIYATALDLYMNNPIAIKDLRTKWGNTQPDELYMNAALAIHGVDPAHNSKEMIHFAMHRGASFTDVTTNFYLQSYYGGEGFTPRFYIDWLDRMLSVDHKTIGEKHHYLISRIVSNKHANGKR